MLTKGRELFKDAATVLDEVFRPAQKWIAYEPPGTSMLTPP
jgi:hypothetical protein